MYGKFRGSKGSKFSGSGRNRSFNKEPEIKDQTFNKGMPTPPETDTFTSTMVSKGKGNDLKPLQTKLTPTETATGEAPKYSILAANNSLMEAKYTGVENLSGNTVVQLQNTNLPRLRKIFDAVQAKARVNYNFYSFGENEQRETVNDEAGKEFDNAFAAIKTSVFNELDYFKSSHIVGTNVKNMGQQLGDYHLFPDTIDAYIKVYSDDEEPEFLGYVGKYFNIGGFSTPEPSLDTWLSTKCFSKASSAQIKTEANWAANDGATYIKSILKKWPDSGYSMLDGDSRHFLQELTLYQTLLQSLALIPNAYNLLLAMEDHLKMMEYQSNDTNLILLLGLFKKAAVKAQVQTVNQALESQYFDTKWYGQWSGLPFMPGRKANGMRDPLICFSIEHTMPEILVQKSNGLNFSTDTFNVNISGFKYLPEYDPDLDVGGEYYVSFSKACQLAAEAINPYFILRYLRQTPIQDVRKLFNNWSDLVAQIVSVAGLISQYFDEVKTMLGVATKSGLCDWRLGVSFATESASKYEPKYNKFLMDIVKNAVCPLNSIKWDSNTFNWHYSAIWDEYTGIPNFDRVNGGCILPFSIRNVVETGAVGSHIIPSYLVFDRLAYDIPTKNMIIAMNRDGEEIAFDIAALTFNDNPEAKRIFPFGDPDVELYMVPEIIVNSDSSATTYGEAYRLLERLFKIGYITQGDNSKFYISPDLISVLDIQVTDFTNSVKNYARATSPIRKQIAGATAGIGFASL